MSIDHDVVDDAVALVDDLHRTVVRTGADADRAGVVRRLVVDRLPLAPARTVDDLVRRVLERVEGLGPLEPLLADPAVTDVLVNGPGPVWVDRGGTLERTEVVVDGDTLHALLQRVLGPLGARLDRTSPTVDARLPDGTRLHAVLSPVAVGGPYVSLRRPSVLTRPPSAYASPPVADLVVDLVVRRRWNLIISGSTGVGKTTLLAGLVSLLDPGERIVVLEEASELALPGRHVAQLEARRPNIEGAGAVSLRQLVREALRMRPDRIVVGEVRGPEAADLLQALSTGHAGSMSTVHASGAVDALARLETLVLAAADVGPHAAVRRRLGSAIDAVCHLRRAGGVRRLVEVVEVAPDGEPGRARPLARGDEVVGAPTRPAR